MKIFITGFQRSGTTLLETLIESHPRVKKMFHETGLLILYNRNQIYNSKKINQTIIRTPLKKNVSSYININFSMKDDTWGEKIPYFYPKLHRHNWRKPFYEYYLKWNRYFKDDAKILHIVRHPYDVIMSNKVTYDMDMKSTVHYYRMGILNNLKKISKIPNAMNIKFEDLVINPISTIKRTLDFCNLPSTYAVIDIMRKDLENKGINKVLIPRISPRRAFSYVFNNRNTKFIKSMKAECIRIDYDRVFKELNLIDGVKYRRR
jgi:hypothetical protein